MLTNSLLIVVIDGWGIPSESSPKDGDAIAAAETPVMDELSQSATGFTELDASSLAVGLPEGLMGNSEVGHLNIGAGRVVWQDVVRIDQTIKKNELSQNEVIKKTFQGAAAGNGRLHLCGLISDGGVVSLKHFIKTTAANFCIARQANSSQRPPPNGPGIWRQARLHPFLWRWS